MKNKIFSMLFTTTLAMSCGAGFCDENYFPPSKYDIDKRENAVRVTYLESATSKAKSENVSILERLELATDLAQAYFYAGEDAKAQSLMRTTIAEYDREPYNKTLQFADCLGWLASELRHKKDFPGALAARKREAEIKLAILEEGDSRRGEMYHDLALSQLDANETEHAFANFKKAVSVFESLAPQESPFHFVQSYAMLAEIEADRNDCNTAIKDCKTCVRLADLLRGVYYQPNDGFYYRMIKVLEKCGAKREAARLAHRRYMIGAVMRINGKPVGKTPKRPHWEYDYSDDDKITIDVILNPKPSI